MSKARKVLSVMFLALAACSFLTATAGAAPSRPNTSPTLLGTPVPPRASQGTTTITGPGRSAGHTAPAIAYQCRLNTEGPLRYGNTVIGMGWINNCTPTPPPSVCTAQAFVEEWLQGRDGDWDWYPKATGLPDESCVGNGSLWGNNSGAFYTCTPTSYGYYYRVRAIGTIAGGTSTSIISDPALEYCSWTGGPADAKS